MTRREKFQKPVRDAHYLLSDGQNKWKRKTEAPQKLWNICHLQADRFHDFVHNFILSIDKHQTSSTLMQN